METEEKKSAKKSCCQGENFLTATLLISAGVMLFLNNFNIIPWNIWHTLWKFWPVILIIWGLEAISGKKIWGRIIVLLIGVFLLLLITTFSVAQVNQDFNNWLKSIYPQWEAIEKQLPQDEGEGLPFGRQGRKVFRCDQVTGECKAIYR